MRLQLAEHDSEHLGQPHDIELVVPQDVRPLCFRCASEPPVGSTPLQLTHDVVESPGHSSMAIHVGTPDADVGGIVDQAVPLLGPVALPLLGTPRDPEFPPQLSHRT